MSQPSRLTVAKRISLLLEHELGAGIDAQRMQDDDLYARDVLLVCDAHRDTELAALARRFRRAPAQDAQDTGSRGLPRTPGTGGSGSGASRPVAPSGYVVPAAASRPQGRARGWFSPSRWLGR